MCVNEWCVRVSGEVCAIQYYKYTEYINKPIFARPLSGPSPMTRILAGFCDNGKRCMCGTQL